MENKPIESNLNNAKIMGIVSYLTFIGWLVAFLLNSPKSEQASFHIRQSLGIYLLFIVSGICFVVPILGWIAGIAGYLIGAVLWLLGIIAAIQGDEKEVPLLGMKFQEWFQGL